jgi:hypothetical protein
MLSTPANAQLIFFLSLCRDMISPVKWLTGTLAWWACYAFALPALAQPPHAAHSARLGGAFATAAGDTLHVEVSWSEQRRVRLFVTDASGSPIPLETLRGFEAHAVAGDRQSPFTLLEVESHFEARVPTLPLPATIAVLLRPNAAAQEERLAFSFREYSAVVAGSSAPVEIPPTLEGILDALAAEHRAMQPIIEREAYIELLGIEDRIRELALALEPHFEAMPVVRFQAPAVLTAVVRACWLLHTILDYGTNPQRDAALRQLGDALRDVADLAGKRQ